MSKYRFLGCHMLLPNNTWFSSLPMFGSLGPDPLVPGANYYPWVFDREIIAALPGGKAIKWWHRLLECNVVVSGEFHYGLDNVDISFDAEGTIIRANVDNEHDVLIHPSPGQNYYWTGGSPAGDSQRVTVPDFYIMPWFSAGPPAFYVNNTHILPHFQAKFGLEVDTPSIGSMMLYTYGVTGSSVVGTFHFDGEDCPLYGFPPISSSDTGPNFMDVTVTPTLYLTHDGTYNPATGLYASGVPTNKF